MTYKNAIKVFISSFLLVFFLSSCFGKKEDSNIVENKDTTISKESSNLSQEKEVSKKTEEEKKKYHKKLEKTVLDGNYKEIIDSLEKKGTDNLDLSEKKSLIISYLRYGNSFFKEKENSKKAMEFLNSMEESYEILYHKGYASEIIKDYDKALEYYNKGLKDENISKYYKSLILSQIGHVYDLKGDINKAARYYMLAEKTDINNSSVYLQKARVEMRKGNTLKSEEYFNKTLKLEQDKFTKSEIYSNLANIYVNKKDGLEKAIRYGIAGINEQKDYYNNYIVLGLAYMKKGDEVSLKKSKDYLEQAVKLFPNSANGYKFLGIYYYLIDDFDNAIKSFEKQLENSEKDITIMGGQKKDLKNSAIYDLARSYALKSDIKNTIKYLKIFLSDKKNEANFTAFLKDFSIKNGPFYKITDDKEFQDFVVDIMKK